MLKDEGDESDFKSKDAKDKLPKYITKNSPLHPYDRSTLSLIWHTLTHWHLFPLIHLGTKKTLQSFDCYYPPKSDDIEYNFNKWCKINKIQEEKMGKGNVGTWKILWAIEGKQFLILTSIMMVSILPGLAVPQIIGELASFYEDTSIDITVGIWLSFALLVIGVIRVGFSAIVMTMASRVLGRVIGLVSYVIYYKAVNASVNNDGKLTIGQKITLLAADTRMIGYALAFEPMFIANFVLMVAVCIFLHLEIGISALAGWLFVIIVSFPVQSVVGKKIMEAWKGYIAISDQRVKFIDETIKGIKVTKMYAWEHALMNEILKYRRKEMVQLLKRIKFMSIMSMINSGTPSLMALIMFGTYVGLGNTLSLRVVFAVITLIQMLGMAIRILPYAIMLAVGGAVAIKRLNTFYNAKDQVDMIHIDYTQVNKDDDDDDSDKYVVYMKDASFRWPKLKKAEEENGTKKQDIKEDKEMTEISVSVDKTDTNAGDEEEMKEGEKDYEFLLDKINMKLEKGKLYALVGSVGSGKSSLIQGILREMEQINGILKVNGFIGNTDECIGYVSQQAFIINDTVRNNILWGLEYDEIYYNKCLAASSLVHDLSILANGDLTEIGERGINLSGGQKQRISFCRALYRAKMTNLFLFDDPLSAVDTHVGNNMFSKGIKELLSDKTILIVMNSHLHLLQYMDEIIIIDAGKLVVQTTYKKVMENEEYAHLLPDDTAKDERKEEEEDVKDDKKENEEEDEEEQDKDKQDKKGKTTTYGAIEQATRDKKGKLTTREDRKSGTVAAKTYLQYFNNAVNEFNHNEVVNDEVPHKSHVKGILLMSLVVFLLLFGQVLLTSSDIWLAFWAEEEEVNRFNGMDDEWWLGIWTVLVVGITIDTFCSSYLFGYMSNKAAQSLHMKTLYCVLRAPMSYFDKTPTGRIINRFSKDTNEMDAELPSAFINFTLMALIVLGYLVVIIISIPWALLLLVVLLPLLYFLQKYFRMSSSDLKRLMQVTTTPVVSQFSETLGGLDTIRAYQSTEQIFLKNIRRKIRLNHKVILSEQLATRWFQQYMDFMIILFLLCQTLLCAFLRDQFETALLSLSVVYGYSLMGGLQWAIRSSIDVEKNFTTVERLLYYEHALKKNAAKNKKDFDSMDDTEKKDGDIDNAITSEAKEINYDYRPPNQSWPYDGRIVIKNLKMRYRKDLDLVLNGLSAEINPGEKIGIVGRTGAGKSSLLLALFRLVEPTEDSMIEIDDINCLNLGLKDLRQSLSIIPQEPVLFSGTLRFNLDPFEEKRDDEIWDVLKKCELYDFINSKDEKLQHPVTEGGNNFSAGQKQLICIGRALLKKSKILALDEATSSIDKHTDSLIQTLIRKEFNNVTVLCIAHRLDTIIDYDKIMVLSKGEIIQFDEPNKLLQDTKGQFYQMINSSHSSSNSQIKYNQNDDQEQDVIHEEED